MIRRSSKLSWLKLFSALLALGACLWAIYRLNYHSDKTPVNAVLSNSAAPTPTAPDAALQTEDSPLIAPPPPEAISKKVLIRLSSTVTYVVDGDTVVLADGRHIRYVGVDTPERHQPYFQEATDLNKRLVEMKTVQLAVCKKHPQDQYGRTLAQVTVDGQAVEDALLSFGLAEIFHDRDCIADCRKNWQLLQEAFQKQRGLFEHASKEPTPAAVADRLIDRFGLVVGVVNNVRESAQAFHLNFGSEWTSDFTVTIEKADLEPFLREKIVPPSLVGLRLTVFGKVVSSNGPRIFAVCPAQIVTIATP